MQCLKKYNMQMLAKVTALLPDKVNNCFHYAKLMYHAHTPPHIHLETLENTLEKTYSHSVGSKHTYIL